MQNLFDLSVSRTLANNSTIIYVSGTRIIVDRSVSKRIEARAVRIDLSM